MSMRDGTCPECGSTDVRKFLSLETGLRQPIFGINLDEHSKMDVEQYICPDCGHIGLFANEPLKEYARERLTSATQRG